MVAQPTSPKPIIYPESDGKPLADNTIQFRLIVTLQGGLDALYRDNPQVFVAGDLFWYPIEGRPKYKQAPDVMVVFNRPKGDRPSYLQWLEGNIPPTVVFEILSPGNDKEEMRLKHLFYERNQVTEYYLYDPKQNQWEGWVRQGRRLLPVESMVNWVSPRLQIRFGHSESGFTVFYPDGREFESYLEVVERAKLEEQRAELERQQTVLERQRAETERERAEQAIERAETERQRAKTERERAEQAIEQAETERQRAEQAERELQRLRERLQEQGIEL